MQRRNKLFGYIINNLYCNLDSNISNYWSLFSSILYIHKEVFWHQRRIYLCISNTGIISFDL